MTAPALTLCDEADARPDLAHRSETKFVFPRGDVRALRAVLRRAATPIRYAGSVSVVRSVYFDDCRLGSCHANLDGLGARQKLRVRWYDAESPARDAWLEVKWRRDLATGKRRFRIPAAAALFSQPLREWPGRLRRAAPAALQPALEKMHQAVTVVEYRREHFELGAARLTLDYDLRFYPLLGQRRCALRFGERLHGTALVECKAPIGAAGLEHRLLRPLRARPVRFSKYVTACQRIGLVADA